MKLAITTALAGFLLTLPAIATTPPDFAATVDADGTFQRGIGVSTVSHDATGVYTVTFTGFSVAPCAATASQGLSGEASEIADAGTVSVSQVTGVANAVRVYTFDTGGAAADRGFHLYLGCAF